MTYEELDRLQSTYAEPRIVNQHNIEQNSDKAVRMAVYLLCEIAKDMKTLTTQLSFIEQKILQEHGGILGNS